MAYHHPILSYFVLVTDLTNEFRIVQEMLQHDVVDCRSGNAGWNS